MIDVSEDFLTMMVGAMAETAAPPTWLKASVDGSILIEGRHIVLDRPIVIEPNRRVVITNCRFTVSPIFSGRFLIVPKSPSKATIKDCVFHIPTDHAIFTTSDVQSIYLSEKPND